jgi:hypothetical protein
MASVLALWEIGKCGEVCVHHNKPEYTNMSFVSCGVLVRLIISTAITFLFNTRGYAPYPELRLRISRSLATEKVHIWPRTPTPMP